MLIISLVLAQYQYIEHDLKTASTNPKIDWTLVAEHIPMYTSPSKHPGNSSIRDIYQPLFDKYGVDLVFSGDNHNYQSTFPLIKIITAKVIVLILLYQIKVQINIILIMEKLFT